MMNVSELTLGEKLSLKGQLFELRKKLNVIDAENKSREEFSFKPQLVTEYYELPDRESSYTKNVERAEMMRKQKLDMLKATRELEDTAEHTFSPAISKKSRSMFAKKQREERETLARSIDSSKSANSSVTGSTPCGNYVKFHRLYEKNAKIQENIQEKRDRHVNYDSKTGQKLFSPKISQKSKTIVREAQDGVSGGGDNEMNAHDFMYRDAVDREERLRQQSLRSRQEVDRMASSSKLNSRSERILEQKAERESRALFDRLDTYSRGSLSYEDLLGGAEILSKVGKIPEEDKFKVTESAWAILSSRAQSSAEVFVTWSQFMKHSMPIARREALSATIPHWDGRVITQEDHGERFYQEHAPRTTIDFTNAKLDEADPPSPSSPGGHMPPPPPHVSAHPAVNTPYRSPHHIPRTVSATKSPMSNSKKKHTSFGRSSARPLSPTTGDNPNEAVVLTPQQVFKAYCGQLLLIMRAEVDEKRENRVGVEKDTFKPHLNLESKKLAQSKLEAEGAEGRIGGLDLMLERSKKSHDRRIAMREAHLEEQMSHCTFTPKISPRAKGGRATHSSSKLYTKHVVNDNLPRYAQRTDVLGEQDEHVITSQDVNAADFNGDTSSVENSVAAEESKIPAHERLYSYRDKPRVPRTEYIPKPEHDLSECTFAPNVKSKFAGSQVNNSTTPEKISGWDKSVQRMRDAQAMRRAEEERKAHEHAESEARYAKSVKVFAKGTKEFTFESDKRSAEKKARKEKTHHKPRLIVDVLLSKHRSVKIKVEEWDDPLMLARKFCKIYSFGTEALTVLEEVIRQSMELNGIAIAIPFEPVKNPLSAAAASAVTEAAEKEATKKAATTVFTGAPTARTRVRVKSQKKEEVTVLAPKVVDHESVGTQEVEGDLENGSDYETDSTYDEEDLNAVQEEFAEEND